MGRLRGNLHTRRINISIRIGVVGHYVDRDKQPPYAPRWTLSASAEQTMPMPDNASLVGGARVHYQSRTLTALEFLPVEEQPGYSLWDFDLTYATAQNRFYVGTYVNNAFNKTALSFSFGTPFSAFMTGTLQAPRVFGIRTGVHF